MKKYLAKFLLWFYLEYIKEEWDILKPFGKVIIYPFWFIKSIIFWILSPIFVLEYIWVNSKMYQEIQKMNEMFLNELNN